MQNCEYLEILIERGTKIPPSTVSQESCGAPAPEFLNFHSRLVGPTTKTMFSPNVKSEPSGISATSSNPVAQIVGVETCAEASPAVVEMATSGGDGEDGGNDDEPPREVPTSAERRNLLRLLRNKVERSSGGDQLIRCVKQLEGSFLGPSATAKETNTTQPFSAAK